MKSLLAVGCSLHVLYDYFTKKKKIYSERLGFAFYGSLTFLDQIFAFYVEKTKFRAIDSCSKYREIPEAFVHSHPVLQFLSVRLNIERIALVFFVKEKEWQWNILSSYFSSSESNVSRIFWHDLRVRLRVRKEAKSDRPRRWELYHGNGESYYGVGDEYDRPGPMNASVRVCTMRVFSSTVAYPHRPRPIEK